MSTREWALGFSFVCAAGCTTAPTDAYVPATRELEQGRLLKALVGLDLIPPAHPHYAEARTLAIALERRMRVAQELVLRGLRMRSEWRDTEAIECFQRAQAVWPEVPGSEEYLLATRNRVAALTAGVQQQVLPEVLTREAETQAGAAAPLVETVLPEADVATLLERGDLDLAIDRLEDQLAAHPEDGRIRGLLVQAMHQRALNRYGLAFLEPALTDWGRVLALEPNHAAARAFSTAARTELEGRRR